MITIIGVGHVFRIKESVADLISRRSPDVVAVELDKDRYWALRHPQSPRDQPFIYQMLSRFQKQVAGSYGAEVGEEMLSAVDTAKRIGARVAFIDLEAQDALQDLMKKMTFREKVLLLSGMAGGVVGGLFGGLFVRKKKIEKELKKFESDSQGYMNTLEKEFPTVKRELIDRRDVHMAKALVELEKQFSNVVAVVGDGHVVGMKKIMGDRPLEVIRLSEVRAHIPGKTPDPMPKKPSTITLSYTYND